MTARADALMAALQFNSVDLEANRQGRLSPAQMRRIKQARQRHLLIAAALFVVFVIGATVFLYAGQLADNRILSGAGGALIVMNALLLGIAGRGAMRMNGDLGSGGVESLAGEVERVLRRGRQSDSFLLRIDGADLPVTKDIFLGFAHERPYRIYRARRSGRLLSAEALA